MTKSTSKTKVVAITAVALAAAGAAYAGFFSLGSGYSKYSVECYDGLRMVLDTEGAHIGYRNDLVTSGSGEDCRLKSDVRMMAEDFCLNRRNPETGKSGINSFSASDKCKVSTKTSGYRQSPPPAGYQGESTSEKKKK